MGKIINACGLVWDFIWEVILLMFFGSVLIIAIPILITFVVLVSIHRMITPGEAMDVIEEIFKNETKKDKDE